MWYTGVRVIQSKHMVRPEKSVSAEGDSPPQASIFRLLRPYRMMVFALVVLTIGVNALNLWVPKIIAMALDSYGSTTFSASSLTYLFGFVAMAIFVLTYVQNIVQVIASEKVARDLRSKLTLKISQQSYASVEQMTSAKLLTNLTSDIDAIKNFVAQAIPSLISSSFLIVGTSSILFWMNWRLALAMLSVLPVIGVTFFFIFRKVQKLFKLSQEAVDTLNKVINESILGAGLIRLLNAEQVEYEKFFAVNVKAKDISMSILRLFASLMPVISFCTNLAILIILVYGGSLVIEGSMTLGEFAAFQAYLTILIFPILVIGFMSSVIAQATASYGRISEVLNTPESIDVGEHSAQLQGNISFQKVGLTIGKKTVLSEIQLDISSGTKTAIIGPTGSGKTQLLYLLNGLVSPTSGDILYDGISLSQYQKQSLHSQIGFVFQDSSLFNINLSDNINFGKIASAEEMAKAITTAELDEFVAGLPLGLETIVSERGSTFSGGQKQRIMLARALALNPTILFLDDFTARVDRDTEQRILMNLARNYPKLTLVSVTQTISAIEHYDQIVLLMDGEILAKGTHEELLGSCPEYVQICSSQQSTIHYEV